MSGNKKRFKKGLTPAEQKTTAAFKLLSERNKILEKSLKSTQDELESYREKYYKADKNHALAKSKNDISALHEILKFIVSVACGGIGVNLISVQDYWKGIGTIVVGIILYSIIVFFDRR